MFAIKWHRAREKPFIRLPIFAVSKRFAKSGQAIATRKFCEARRRPLMATKRRFVAPLHFED
jgi:hypothetical protein